MFKIYNLKFNIIVLLLSVTVLKLFSSGVSSVVIQKDYERLNNFNLTPGDSLEVITITGIVKNNFKEPVDSVEITCRYKDNFVTVFSDYEGLFRLMISHERVDTGSLRVSFSRPDYYYADTALLLNKIIENDTLSIILLPKYKILFKGRIYAGTYPVDDVMVTVSHLRDTWYLKTLGCYYDDENYWNCLFNGMFKTDIITENPEDSIYFSFFKYGFKPQSHKIKFAEYSGELIKYKLKYADSIPDLPDNNLNFKLSYPIGKEADLFMGLSFYSKINSKYLERLRTGLELSWMNLNLTVTFDADTEVDTSIICYYIGPSFLLYLTKPHIRRFSTYLGSTFSLAFQGGNFVCQPFIGTRFFIDMRKSISFDVRYLKHNLGNKQFYYINDGNVITLNKNVHVERILLGAGIQINF